MPESANTPSPHAVSRFRETYRREHGTTRKVLAAYPPGQHDFRPHERSNSALQLARTFVTETEMLRRAIAGEPVMGGAMAKAPDEWNACLAEFERLHAEVLRALERPTALAGTVQFYVAPGQMGDIPTEDFVWFMLHDQIHHRGQLSVYVRMAGGKVPSIYGPSADEPWR